MALKPFLALTLFALSCLSVQAAPATSASVSVSVSDQLSINGTALPDDFIYGCGLTAYQVEGAWKADGKGPSIWDTFVHDKKKGHVVNDDTGDVAMDFYHTYKKDIPLFKKALGINNFDFTIAWTRILPQGRGDTLNQKGLQYYQNVADVAHAQGLTTTCTLYHWDLPQALQDQYGGWASQDVVEDFAAYARQTMQALGSSTCDRWISMNEPRTFCVEGYGGSEGESAPGIADDPATMYTCMHNALLSHGRAHEEFVKLKHQGIVSGTFGIKIDGSPARPLNPSNAADRSAARRSNAFEIGWDVAPLTTGDYPEEMRETLGHLLPKFTPEQSKMVRDSYDIIYFDGYTSQYAAAIPEGEHCGKSSDYWPTCIETSQEDAEGNPIGVPTGSDWNFLVNDTLISGLTYMHAHLGVKALAIGETGMVLQNATSLTMLQRIADDARIDWYKNVLQNVQLALQNGIPLVGFIPWSCIRNFEWSNGYDGDFGLVYAEPGKNQKRTPKRSAYYLNHALHS